jgi:hypothetical protein
MHLVGWFIWIRLLKNISLAVTVVVFTDICVFRFSILVSADPQKYSLVLYLKTWGSTQSYVAFLSHDFHSRSFVSGRTHMAWNSLTLHKRVSYLMSSLFSWLVDGACLQCLAVKTLSGEGSLLVWASSVCCNPMGPRVFLWTTGTVGRQVVLWVQWVKSVSLVSLFL